VGGSSIAVIGSAAASGVSETIHSTTGRIAGASDQIAVCFWAIDRLFFKRRQEGRVKGQESRVKSQGGGWMGLTLYS
jgi:hypothetical protein